MVPAIFIVLISMSTDTTRSTSELDELKKTWKSDPHWDIEHTEGFEAHTEELLAFGKLCEAEWQASRDEQQLREDKALGEELASLGAIGVLKLIKSLQKKLGEAEERIEKLENPLSWPG